jgi:hypothetical protein
VLVHDIASTRICNNCLAKSTRIDVIDKFVYSHFIHTNKRVQAAFFKSFSILWEPFYRLALFGGVCRNQESK